MCIKVLAVAVILFMITVPWLLFSQQTGLKSATLYTLNTSPDDIKPLGLKGRLADEDPRKSTEGDPDIRKSTEFTSSVLPDIQYVDLLLS